jgi:hypothetical protein
MGVGSAKNLILNAVIPFTNCSTYHIPATLFATMESIIPLPENMRLVSERGSLIIRRRWFTPVVFFFIFFALFWNGFMVVWMTLALTKGQLMMAAFGSIHALVGLGLIYFCVATCVNKTDVSVDPNHLKVQHYPLPWFGNKQFRVHEITQLFCKEQINRTKNGVNISYRVHVILRDGREQTLVKALSNDTQARFIEHEIESVLGLENQAVAGELRS